MSKLHTHYDNLKVSRDAPVGVIKAAYKALAQENHPDKCKSPDAPRRMQVINDAYAVLSDSSKRAVHDKWIAANEKVAAPAPAKPSPKSAPAPAPTPAKPYDLAYVEKLHAAYREAFVKERRSHAAEIAGLKRVQRFEKKWGILMGLLLSIPMYIIFASVDESINKAHADQAQQYQEANMRRN